MKRKTTAALLLQHSSWFEKTDNTEAITELDEDGDRIVYKLSPFLDIIKTWSVFSPETAVAVSVELRSLEIDLIILVYQTRVDHDYIEKILRGVGSRPLVAWCYLPWRRIPHPMTYEDLVKGSSFYGMTAALSHLRDLNAPYLAAFGSADDPSVLSNIEAFSCAAQVANEITKTRVGILHEGESMANLESDCSLSAFGLTPEGIPINTILSDFQEVTNDAVENYISQLKNLNVEIMVTDETLRQGVRSTLAIANLTNKNEYDHLAGPDHSQEFQDLFGLCPGLPLFLEDSKEGLFIPSVDYGAIVSSIVLNMISDSPIFTMRIWFWDKAKNIVVGGLGGIQNPSGISSGPMWILGDYECARDDPDGGAQLEFITKPGRVTLLQISSTSTGCRAMLASGICLESDPWIEGIPHAVVRIDCSIGHFLSNMAEFGGSANWVICYGDYIKELKALFELKAIQNVVLLD